jgi:hypothetical protein
MPMLDACQATTSPEAFITENSPRGPLSGSGLPTRRQRAWPHWAGSHGLCAWVGRRRPKADSVHDHRCCGQFCGERARQSIQSSFADSIRRCRARGPRLGGLIVTSQLPPPRVPTILGPHRARPSPALDERRLPQNNQWSSCITAEPSVQLCVADPAAAVAGDAGGGFLVGRSARRSASGVGPTRWRLKTVARRARRWEDQRCLSAIDEELQRVIASLRRRDSGLQSGFDSVWVEGLPNEFECGREIFFESGPDLARRKDEPTFGLAAGTQFDGQ